MRLGLTLKNGETRIGGVEIGVEEGTINESKFSGPMDDSEKKGPICLHKRKS